MCRSFTCADYVRHIHWGEYITKEKRVNHLDFSPPKICLLLLDNKCAGLWGPLFPTDPIFRAVFIRAWLTVSSNWWTMYKSLRNPRHHLQLYSIPAIASVLAQVLFLALAHVFNTGTIKVPVKVLVLAQILLVARALVLLCDPEGFEQTRLSL